jgi:phosphoribosylformylglycinamidine cyclo-ligase
VLVAATDGVGTKLRIAIDTGNVDTSASTLWRCASTTWSARGRSRLFFLDYFATGKLEVEKPRGRRRHRRGLPQSGCALIGGETAEMPGMYAPGDFDLAGFAVGAMERGGALPRAWRRAMFSGDLASDGVHSNGYSLVRRVVERAGWAGTRRAPFSNGPLGAALLAPTRLLRPRRAGGGGRAGCMRWPISPAAG